jgi:hypothetical protein
MRLELRNLQNQETYWVSPEGMIFGREGGPADIRVADQSVSKRHAKVYQRDGTWFLEDLKSVNGTVVNSKRITEPMPLSQGFVFALSKHKFEVVRIEGEEVATNQSLSQRSIEPPPPREAASQSKRRAQPPPQPALDDDYAASDRRGERPSSGAAAGPAGPEPKGVGYFFVAVPKAVAYYMAAVPLLALNPPGTIKKGIENMRFMPMGRMELIAYALPAFFFSSMCGTIGAVFAIVIAGGGIGTAIGGAISGIITAVITAIIIAAVIGFFGDRVFAWLIRLLKGDSDARGRTNFFVATYTASVLVAIPNALSAIFTALVARLSAKFGFIALLNVVPIVVTTVAGVVSLFVMYSWMKHFGVHHIVQKILLVLMALTLLGGLAGIGSSALAAISSIGSGGGGSSGDVAGVDADAIAKAQEQAKKAMEEAAASGDAEAIKKATEQAKKAMEEATAASEAAAKKAGDAAEKAEKAASDKAEEAADKVKAEADKAEKAAEKAAEKVAEKAEKAVEKVEKVDKVDATDKPLATATPSSKGAAKYAQFVEQKTAVEKAIEEDPTLLKGTVEDDYKAMLKCLREQDARPEKKSRDYDSALEPYYKRKTEAQQYGKCGDIVARLFKRIDQ